jgi:TolB-like protein
LWITGSALVAAVLVAGTLFYRKAQHTEREFSANKIVVVPFRIATADSSLRYLGEGVADLIAPMLTGEGGPVAVDSRSAISAWNRITRGRDGTADDARRVARELGAAIALSGAIVEANGRLTMTGSVIPSNGGDARALPSVSGLTDSVDKVLDKFVGQLLVRQSGVAETSVASITSQSLPAIRAYLEGRAAYRGADEKHAVENFSRALDLDSTFALAALDLAVATGNLLRTEICRTAECRVFAIVPGLSGTRWDENVFDRAARVAWDNRSRLGNRDRALLDAIRGNNYPGETPARETFANLGRAVQASPDRPETHYLLGTLLMYQGAALGLSSWQADAESAFRTASRLDSSYLAPLAGLVEIAAFSMDTAKLHRAGIVYLSRDSTGPTADFVRWVVAAGTKDVVAQRAIRARLSLLDRLTLDHIYLTSQMSGLGLEDADTVALLLIAAARDPFEKSVAFRRAQVLALNRGRPADATNFLRRMSELRVSANAQTFAIAAAVTGDGERTAADSASSELARATARDTLGQISPNLARRLGVTLTLQALWYLEKGDTARALAATSWLRRHAEANTRNKALILLTDMLLASRARRSDGAALRARVDSISLRGCCEVPEFVNTVLARAYEESGNAVDALRVIRRAAWYYPPRSLSSFIRKQGQLAAQTGNRAEAIRAYEHYLALRSNPEPSQIPQRDSVRAELNQIRGAR